MTILAEFLSAHAGMALAIGGLLLGALFGLVAQRTNFCTMGAVSDGLLLNDWRRMRAWGLAIATALAGTQVAVLAGLLPIERSIYLGPTLNWAGHIIGGGIFGFGMALAGGCPSRNLVRAGSGDLRSLIVLLVVAITGYATLSGIGGPLRVWLDSVTQVGLARIGSPTQGLGDVIVAVGGLERRAATVSVWVAITALLLFVCVRDRAFRASSVNIIGGLGIGVLVVAGWLLTGLAFDEMSNRAQLPASFSFVRPLGDTLEWLQRATALGLPTFAVTSVIGVLVGAGVTACTTGGFQLRTFASKADTLANLGGAALMGIGGVLGVGCSVGQGITGLSTLAIGSLLAFCAILAGTALGIRCLERWMA
jgi:uncharacterized membrane protein YedE/YeeE